MLVHVKFSLILATVGRSEELRTFLVSLRGQTHGDIQLIVVDQNQDDRVKAVLAEAACPFPVVYLHTRPGLSHARNVGLRHAEGDVITFPDDDCWYEPDVLKRVNALLEGNPNLDGMTGRSVDADGKTSGGVFAKQPGPVKFLDVWVKATSFTIFLRRAVCEAVGEFDETLGVGAGTDFGSAEDPGRTVMGANGLDRLDVGRAAGRIDSS